MSDQVAISYVVMLAYIALALGYFPVGASPLAILVTGRVSLGLGGVLIVAGAVAGALGLCSLFGMWSTLIIMEVSASFMWQHLQHLVCTPPHLSTQCTMCRQWYNFEELHKKCR